MFTAEAADLAPTILPKLEKLADLKKMPLTAEDTKAISAAIFEGTLSWARDLDRRRPDRQPERRLDPRRQHRHIPNRKIRHVPGRIETGATEALRMAIPAKTSGAIQGMLNFRIVCNPAVKPVVCSRNFDLLGEKDRSEKDKIVRRQSK